MARKLWATVPPALGLALAMGTWGGADEPKVIPAAQQQQPKDAGQKIGDAVDDVVQGVKRGARATTETVSEQVQKIRTSVHDMGVQARVYSRLHWDKNLHNCRIEIEVKEGTAILAGSVVSLQAKAKADELARDTLGVERVDDRLTVEPGATEAPASVAKPRR
jgi:osmotically-inducible protein OsmY